MNVFAEGYHCEQYTGHKVLPMDDEKKDLENQLEKVCLEGLREVPISPLLRVLSSAAGAVVAGGEEESVVTSEERARLPRIYPEKKQ